MVSVDNKAIKIPDTHYVGFQKRQGDGVPLGFMTIDGTDKASLKRKATVDNWARGNTWQAHSKQATLPAKTFDNKPLVGFKMGKNISYGSGWDSRHDKWRIEDPRGFELEITSGNLEEIMRLCTIERGEILEQCIWGRLGTENILIPISSPIYTTAAANTDRLNSKGTIRDAKPGYHLVFKNGDEGTYLGKMCAFGYSYMERYMTPHGYESTRRLKAQNFRTLNEKPVHTYGVLNKEGQIHRIVMRDSLALSAVNPATELTQDEACDTVNKLIQNMGTSIMDTPGKWGSGYERVLQVAPSKIDPTTFVHSFEKKKLGTTDETEDFIKAHKASEYDYYSNYVIANIDDDWVKANFNVGWKTSTYAHSKTPIAFDDHNHTKLDNDALERFEFKDITVMEKVTGYSGFYGRNSEREVPVKVKWAGKTPADVTFYKIVGNFKTFSGVDMFVDYTYY